MLQGRRGHREVGSPASIHSKEEVGGQGLGGLAFFAVLLCASLVAKALNRDRNGQAMQGQTWESAGWRAGEAAP